MAKQIRLVNQVAGATLLAVLAQPGRWTSRAEAHPEWSPIRVNRYAKLVLGGEGGPRLVYTILYGEGPALVARRAADRDGDRRLDERERALLGAGAAAAVRAGLRLSIDGAALTPTPSATDVGLAGEAVAPAPFSIDLTYPLALPAGEHVLLIDDRVEVPSEGDSEVSLEVAPPVELITSHRGETGQGLERSFSFRGPRFSALEDRRVGLRIRVGGGRAAWLRRAPAWGGAAALILAGLLVWRARRRRR